MTAPYDELKQRLREAETLASVNALLSWDQETMMPPKAAAFRAEEQSMLSTLTHERVTDPRIGELLDACESDPSLTSDPAEAANLREIRRDFERARQVPATLVAELSETSSRALDVWKGARHDNDFKRFEPWLAKQVRLNRQKAECHGVPEGGELYDQLLEDYEPGMTTAQLQEIFGPLRGQLAELIEEMAGKTVRGGALERLRLPVPLQHEFNQRVARRLGYDFDAGRLDVSTHPFTQGLAPGDTRITTRYREDAFADALGSTMHEVGHALYEQGVPKADRLGQPLGDIAGLGIHESQSRLWENQVGRSKPFWGWALVEARQVFGSGIDGLTVDDLFRGVNQVVPHLIRVESDETTYNMHILIRFHIERALIRGEIEAADVPAEWNRRVAEDLGLQVPDDTRGCLQDIHWAMGSIGYFPTYTLGNIYAAQFWETICEQLPDVEEQIGRGEFGALLSWLRENIHAHARRYSPPELCRRVTGHPLDHRPLIRYLRRKLEML